MRILRSEGLVVAALTIVAVAMGTAATKRFRGNPAPAVSPTIEPSGTTLDLAAQGLRLGVHDAPLQIIEFADFQCPFCARASGTLDRLREKHHDSVAVVFRHLPISTHAFAIPAALAAECANAQHRFDEMHTVLFDQRGLFRADGWQELARIAGVDDTVRFARCMRDSTYIKNVRRDDSVGRGLKIAGTPTFFFRGVRFTGAPSYEFLDSLLSGTVAVARR